MNPLSATEVRVLSRLIERTLALPPDQREAYLAGLPEPQQVLVPRIRERLTQLAQTEADDAAAAPPPPPRAQRPEQRVGPYRLLQPLGGSAQGHVWQAERVEGSARQRFVLRLPAPAEEGSTITAAQQAAERQVVLLPEHADILRLIDAGIDAEGRFYRVLPHIEGLSLVEHAQRRGMGAHALAALMLKVCRPVAHVHDEEVACTGLRTSSYRVDDEGRVLLLDWGQGRTLRADTRAADIRALGAILQALLSGSDLDAAPAPDAPPPRPVASGPDLAHVLQRALQSGGATPYATVHALIDDLNRVLAWQPVPGAGGGSLHLGKLYLRRHRLRLALGFVGVALLLAATMSGWNAWQRTQQRGQRADQTRVFLQQNLPEALPEALAQAAAAPQAYDLAIEAPRVQQALEQARFAFPGEPVLRGQVITALGVRFRVLGQPDQALAVLQEAVTLLQGTSRADEPALHAARAELALQWQQEGSAAGRTKAATLAQQVLDGCTGGRALPGPARHGAAGAVRALSAAQRRMQGAERPALARKARWTSDGYQAATCGCLRPARCGRSLVVPLVLAAGRSAAGHGHGACASDHVPRPPPPRALRAQGGGGLLLYFAAAHPHARGRLLRWRANRWCATWVAGSGRWGALRSEVKEEPLPGLGSRGPSRATAGDMSGAGHPSAQSPPRTPNACAANLNVRNGPMAVRHPLDWDAAKRSSMPRAAVRCQRKPTTDRGCAVTLALRLLRTAPCFAASEAQADGHIVQLQGAGRRHGSPTARRLAAARAVTSTP